jgi:hypothetical protein
MLGDSARFAVYACGKLLILLAKIRIFEINYYFAG